MIRLCSRNKRWSFVFYSNISLPCHAIVLPLYFGCWYKLEPFSKMPIEYAWRLISRLLQINFMHDFQFFFCYRCVCWVSKYHARTENYKIKLFGSFQNLIRQI
jgi:hypothetical protein